MSGDSPELWLIAGPNGAGKTTFSQQKPLSDLLGHVVLVNPDDVALQISGSRVTHHSMSRIP